MDDMLTLPLFWAIVIGVLWIIARRVRMKDNEPIKEDAKEEPKQKKPRYVYILIMEDIDEE